MKFATGSVEAMSSVQKISPGVRVEPSAYVSLPLGSSRTCTGVISENLFINVLRINEIYYTNALILLLQSDCAVIFVGRKALISTFSQIRSKSFHSKDYSEHLGTGIGSFSSIYIGIGHVTPGY